MTFTHLPQIAAFIRSTHCSFAGTFTSEALAVLANMKAQMEANTALVGITYDAMTDASHGELNTMVTITKLPAGGYEYTEVVA